MSTEKFQRCKFSRKWIEQSSRKNTKDKIGYILREDKRGCYMVLWDNTMTLQTYSKEFIETIPSESPLSSVSGPIEREGWVSEGLRLIAEERRRQIEVEKWDYEHDADYKNGEMMGAAGCYVASALNKHFQDISTSKIPWARFQVYDFGERNFLVNDGDRGDRQIKKAGWEDGWPWDEKWDKRKKHDKIRSLVIAGALIAAELDRLNPLPKPPIK